MLAEDFKRVIDGLVKGAPLKRVGERSFRGCLAKEYVIGVQ